MGNGTDAKRNWGKNIDFGSGQEELGRSIGYFEFRYDDSKRDRCFINKNELNLSKMSEQKTDFSVQ